MKKITIYSLFILLVFTSCNDVLDKDPLDSLTSDYVWNSASNATLYLNTLYSENLPSFAGTSNTNLTTEGTGTGTGEMMYGRLTTDDSYGIYTTAYYNKIRKINILFGEIDGGTISETNKTKIKAQAYFLRAWAYWKLIMYYGGVPMVMESEDPAAGDELLVSRNSAEECIDLIVTDLDSAIAGLPAAWSSDYGRITRGGAAALKGRVLLFYASPQFNPDDLSERWQTAYDANSEALTLCKSDGYELYDDYENIFLAEDDASEALFVKIYDGTNLYHGYESSVRPASENSENTTGSNPTWQLVKAYPMADGYLPGESPNYDWDSLYYWKNRDPRFYATIAYNGCTWELNGESGRKQWTFVESTGESNYSSTQTGFYCRRNVDESILSSETSYTGTDWIEIRLAEVYLNLAECAAELSKVDEAKELVIDIRERAGVEEGTGDYGVTASTSDDMVDAIMLERQIEFAYENKRHWDLRRRNLYKNYLNGNRRSGIYTNLVYPDSIYTDAEDSSDTLAAEQDYEDYFNENIDNILASVDLDEDYYNYFSTDFDNEYDAEDINYIQPKYNFYFIPQDALDDNENLEQTIYWTESGGFDPLAD